MHLVKEFNQLRTLQKYWWPLCRQYLPCSPLWVAVFKLIASFSFQFYNFSIHISIWNCLKDGDKRNALVELQNTLMGCDISPFEVNHSGLVSALLEYLVNKSENRDQRIRTFLNVFANCPVSWIKNFIDKLILLCH